MHSVSNWLSSKQTGQWSVIGINQAVVYLSQQQQQPHLSYLCQLMMGVEKLLLLDLHLMDRLVECQQLLRNLILLHPNQQENNNRMTTSPQQCGGVGFARRFHPHLFTQPYLKRFQVETPQINPFWLWGA